MVDIGVSEETLLDSGEALIGAAESAKSTGSELSGATSAGSMGAAMDGFSISDALGTCESSWEDAVDAMLAKVSLTGDLIKLAGEDYGHTETINGDSFDFGLE